jgi:hypothetical protein
MQVLFFLLTSRNAIGSVTRLAWRGGQNKTHLLSGCTSGTVKAWETAELLSSTKGNVDPWIKLDFEGPITVLSWCPWSPHSDVFVVGVGNHVYFYSIEDHEGV